MNSMVLAGILMFILFGVTVDSFIISASKRGFLTTFSITSLNAYVPDGLTPAQYKKIKEKEQKKVKNLGNLGPRGFQSRSMQSFQVSEWVSERTRVLLSVPEQHPRT